jgi:hypothetical protein
MYQFLSPSSSTFNHVCFFVSKDWRRGDILDRITTFLFSFLHATVTLLLEGMDFSLALLVSSRDDQQEKQNDTFAISYFYCGTRWCPLEFCAEFDDHWTSRSHEGRSQCKTQVTKTERRFKTRPSNLKGNELEMFQATLRLANSINLRARYPQSLFLLGSS